MSQNTQFYRYMKDKPVWIDDVDFDNQPDDVQDFYLREADKAENGFNIGFHQIHPWLYWHTNFWTMFIDVEDKTKVSGQDRIKTTPDLRDNEWYINENLLKAEASRKGIVMFGTRRFGKSAFISSYIGWNATFKYGGTNSVVGGSDKDLNNVTSYIDIGLDNVPEFFRYEKITSDWNNPVELGYRDISNKKEIFSTMTVINVDAGKKKATQKTAGFTPTSFVIDEIGKFPVKKTFNTAKYSFATPFGWRCIPILLGTGGEVELAQDAQDILNNPDIHNLIEMDWNLLDKYTENPTWQKRKWGIFVPAQMSLEPGLIKKVIPLSEYLNEEENEELNRITIQVTDWANSTKILQDRREALKDKDRDTYLDEMMFLPLDPDDCFLSAGENPFPSLEATRHRDRIKEEGDTGKKVEIYKIDGGTKIAYEFSDKGMPKFPHPGGNIDAPILIFEDPPEDNINDGTYVAGLDHYKHDKSSTDSLGALYIYKRHVNLDEYADRIVACYVSRPNSIETFNIIAEKLIEGYGAECLQENADISFQQYLKRKNKAEMWLADGQEMMRAVFSKNVSQNNRFGLPPTPKNQQYILNLVISYCWEEIVVGQDEDGNNITVLGVERIQDLNLLEEIINFKYGGNFDRIIAFGHALAWAKYLDSMNVMPNKNKNKNKPTYNSLNKPSRRGSMYSNYRFGMYSTSRTRR